MKIGERREGKDDASRTCVSLLARRGKIRGANINTRRSASRLFIKGPPPPTMGADAGVRLRFGILSTEIEPRRAAALSPLYFFSLTLSFSPSLFIFVCTPRYERARVVFSLRKVLFPTAQFFLRVETKQLYETNASGRPGKGRPPRDQREPRRNVDEDKK